MKTVTITMNLHDDVNQNDVKTWVKSCPYSPEGGQTVTWQNIPNPEPKPVKAKPVKTVKPLKKKRKK